MSHKKLQKRPAQVSKLAYLATLVVKNSSKLGFKLTSLIFRSLVVKAQINLAFTRLIEKFACTSIRKSFKALARELPCNITHPPFTRRSCLAVPISGTKELASHTTNIAWRTRSDTFVLIPLLELTRAVAQHHAGFVLKLHLFAKYIVPLF